jgi:PEGA domain
VPGHERSVEDRAKVLAAAQAVASWARARRATWTDVPLAAPDIPVREVVKQAAFEPEPPTRVMPAIDVKHEPSSLVEPGPSVWSETVQPGIRRWGPRVIAAGLLVAALAAAVRYAPRLWHAAKRSTARIAPAAAAPQSLPTEAPAGKTTGSLHVASTPSSAKVLLDGTARGVTPLTLDDVPVGRHTIVLQSSSGTVTRVVAVAPGIVTDVDESVFSGWVVVYAPFEVSITEGGRAMRLDERSEVMLPAGPHELRLVNRRLGFEEVRRVDLKPGDRATISIKPPRSAITVTASEPAEVWLDGVRLGDTPLTGAPVDLGTHELLLKRAGGGDRRMTITATVQPVAINVDFSRPPA